MKLLLLLPPPSSLSPLLFVARPILNKVLDEVECVFRECVFRECVFIYERWEEVQERMFVFSVMIDTTLCIQRFFLFDTNKFPLVCWLGFLLPICWL